MQLIDKFLSSTDFISYSPSLLIDGSTRAKNIFGGTLSLIVMVVTSLATYFFSAVVLLRLQPTVNFNKYYQPEENFRIVSNNFFAAISLRRTDSSNFEDPKTIYGIKALRFHYKNIEENGEKKQILETTPVPMEQCTEEHIANHPEMLKLPFHKYSCFGLDADVQMFNPLGHSGDNAYINVYAHPCKPEEAAQGNFECAPKETIERELEVASFIIRLDNYYVDHSSFQDPVKRYIKSIFPSTSQSIYNRTYLNFGKLKYDTDIGLVFSDHEVREYFNFQDTSSVSYSMSEDKKAVKLTFHQFTFSFGSSGLHDNYKRVYRKLQNVMADIGGFSKGCMLIAMFLNLFFSKSLMLHKIFDKSFFSFFGVDKGATNIDLGKSQLGNGTTVFGQTNIDLVNNTHASKIGDVKVRKIKLRPMSYFLKVACCRRKSSEHKTAGILNKYLENALDVRTVLKISQKIELLKNFLLKTKDRELFDKLDFLVDLSGHEQEWTNSSEALKSLKDFIRVNNVDSNLVMRFIGGNFTQNFISSEPQTNKITKN